MTPSEKYNFEKDELKTARMNRILEAGFNLFSQKGIDTIAMTDIAKKAEIGVASLYRYFETKDEIAIRTTIWAWEKQRVNILPDLASSEYSGKNGLEQVQTILNHFIKMYEEQQDFLRYIYFFDSYAVRSELSQDRLIDYEKLIGSVQSVIKSAIIKGINDGSINSEYKDDIDILYFSLMHSFFSTTQKLCLSGNLLKMDTQKSGKHQLEMLAKILINGLTK